VKIVFLSPSGTLGGAETALLDMLAALRESRPSWTFNLIASSDGPLIARAQALKVPAEVLEFPSSLSSLGEWGRRGSGLDRARLGAHLFATAIPTAVYLRRLSRELSSLQPDIVHTNGLKMHLLGAHAAPARARVVWHLHDYPRSRPITARLLSRDVHRSAVVLANSESVAAQARELFGEEVRVRTVYNAIDLNRFAPAGPKLDLDAICHLPPLPRGGVRIGLVGTFARWKGHRVFLEALSKLPAGMPFRGYVIGGPIYQTQASQCSDAELRDVARSLGIGEAVGFTGHLDDVPAALRALDIVVHASTEPEPFGLVIAEAMACGRPVVASAAGGALEAGDGAAIVHTPGDSDELASRLSELAKDGSLRSSLGEKGRTVATARFGRHELAGTLVPIYEALGSSRS
jgi:glycosyltransferase involved in cell wall biosynthesis